MWSSVLSNDELIYFFFFRLGGGGGGGILVIQKHKKQGTVNTFTSSQLRFEGELLQRGKQKSFSRSQNSGTHYLKSPIDFRCNVTELYLDQDHPAYQDSGNNDVVKQGPNLFGIHPFAILTGFSWKMNKNPVQALATIALCCTNLL